MFGFELIASEKSARAGLLSLPHGRILTPTFMPVGTQGSVRALSPADLESVGTQIVLGNSYHLHVRPGEETVATLGGLHRFMGWKRGILTDSGGFQIFSLAGSRKVSEDGVEFQSHVDGRRLFISPEVATEIQWHLGSDIAMALDHLVAGDSGRPAVEDALARTTRWLVRSVEAHGKLSAGQGDRQTLWPIVQGATYPDLRRDAVRAITQTGEFTGFAVGGLAVGESKSKMYETLEELGPYLPSTHPRYLMGVGFPEDLLNAVARGMDLFDCVAPTRNGRNGSAYTQDGSINIRNAAFERDDGPLDEHCDCEACQSFSRGYLRHLFVAEELLGLRLLSLHNVRFLINLAEQARARIIDGSFHSWSRDWLTRYRQSRRVV